MFTKPITTALAALALAGLLGACSGGGDSDEAGPASIDPDATSDDTSGDEGGGANPEDVALRYAECMREHGVDMPDPQVDDSGDFSTELPDGVAPDVMAEAEAACADILEEARTDREPLSPEEIAERRDQAVAVAECMRERGHDFPDPVVNDEGGIEQETPEGGRPGDPGFDEFMDDLTACEEAAGMPAPEEGGPSLDDGGDGSGS
jgi:hypothetical protein